MAYLMDIAFDNSRRLIRKSYMFEYKEFNSSWFKTIRESGLIIY